MKHTEPEKVWGILDSPEQQRALADSMFREAFAIPAIRELLESVVADETSTRQNLVYAGFSTAVVFILGKIRVGEFVVFEPGRRN